MPVKVKALRGVCIGIEKHMKPDDVEQVDEALANYLVSIKAVERVADAPPAKAAATETTKTVTSK